MQIPALQQTKIDVADMPLDRLAGSTKIPQKEKIERATQAFEAILLRQILEETQKPVFASGLVNDSTTSSIYRDMIVNQMAQDIAKSGTLGLARTLNQEFEHPSSAGTKNSSSAKADADEPGPKMLAAPKYQHVSFEAKSEQERAGTQSGNFKPLKGISFHAAPKQADLNPNTVGNHLSQSTVTAAPHKHHPVLKSPHQL